MRLHPSIPFLFVFALSSCNGPAIWSAPSAAVTPAEDETQEPPTISDAKDDITLTSIAITSDPALALTIGEKKQLFISVQLSNDASFNGIASKFNYEGTAADGAIVWYSNDENVASVTDGGKITAVGLGTTTIKASLINKSAGISVSVEEKDDALTAQIVNHGTPAIETAADPSPEVPTTESPLAITDISILTDVSDWIVGEQRELAAQIRFSDGQVFAVGEEYVFADGSVADLTWQSSNASLLQISDGKALAVGYGEAVFSVSFEAVSAAASINIKMATDEPADPLQAFLGEDEEITFSPGSNAGYGSDHFPDNIFGLPDSSRTDVLSLGNGGEILIKLNGYVIVDGSGQDFTVFENPFSGWTERAQIAVSDNGTDFTPFFCDAFDADGDGLYQGCAGVTEINYSENADDMLHPELSGGDGFDLAEVGIGTVTYLKIIDSETCQNPILCAGTSAGFDFDAIAIINGAEK